MGTSDVVKAVKLGNGCGVVVRHNLDRNAQLSKANALSRPKLGRHEEHPRSNHFAYEKVDTHVFFHPL